MLESKSLKEIFSKATSKERQHIIDFLDKFRPVNWAENQDWMSIVWAKYRKTVKRASKTL